MITHENILNSLKHITDPSSGADIVAAGILANIQIKDQKVSLEVNLATNNPQVQNALQQKIEEAILKLEGINVVKVQIKSSQSGASSGNPNTLTNIKNIIAVSSCKGGVGKSTVAAHLTQELAQRGHKVGLLDADIYGPSLPTLFGLNQVDIYTNEKKELIPVEKHNIKLMSFGFLLGNAPAVMRGPIVTRYIQQLLHGTSWGKLDYLLIDMPPGTGDIHLTITQTTRLDGAIIVTTPHTLSLVDVARGILMFEKVHVPILGVIENMSYFIPEDGDKKHYIFGKQSSDNLQQAFGVETLAELPILKTLSQTLYEPISSTYVQEAVDRLTEKMTNGSLKSEIPTIEFDENEIRFKWKNKEQWAVSNFDLRLNSKDALSVDEMTGESLLKAEDIRKDIAAKEITPLGNYAIGIVWNDGHSSGIYPYPNIKELATISDK